LVFPGLTCLNIILPQTYSEKHKINTKKRGRIDMKPSNTSSFSLTSNAVTREEETRLFKEIRQTSDPVRLLELQIEALGRPEFNVLDKMSLSMLVNLRLRKHPLPPLTPAKE